MEIKKIRRILRCRSCGEILSDEIEERAVEKKDRFPRHQQFSNSGRYCFTCQENSSAILDELDPNPSCFMPLAHIHV